MLHLFRAFPQKLAAQRRRWRRREITSGEIGWLDAKESGWYNPKTGDLLKGFRIAPEDVMLDVGCGEGGASRFAANCGAYVIATDIDPAKVQTVTRKLTRSNARGFKAIVSDSNPLPLEDETATKVVSLEVLEHVDDPRQFLSELVRVGKQGAQYLITCPDPASEKVQSSIAPPAYWSKPNHVRVVQRDEFDQLIQDAGLKIEHRTQYSFFWALWWVLFWASKQEFGAQPESPILYHWAKTWEALMTTPDTGHIRQALNEFMPKSQVVIARKAA